jgi:hypothetical protein
VVAVIELKPSENTALKSAKAVFSWSDLKETSLFVVNVALTKSFKPLN